MTGGHDYAFYNGSIGNMRTVKSTAGEVARPEGGGLIEGIAEYSAHSNEVNPLRKKSVADETEDADRAALMENHQATLSSPRKFDKQEEQQNCSPQLLHIDRNGSPLWFNGWVSTDKFTAHTKFAKFDAFIVQPPELGRETKTSVWEIQNNNVVCLRGDTFKMFNDEEKKILDLLVDMAAEQYHAKLENQ